MGEEWDESRLEEAGLIVLGRIAIEGLMCPEDAWKLVSSISVRPTAIVHEEIEDYLEDVDRQWESIAHRSGLIDRDSTFLLSPSGVGTSRLPWFKVRLSDDVRLAKKLALYPGEPEFVTMSNCGDLIIGVTTEEDGVWIILVRP